MKKRSSVCCVSHAPTVVFTSPSHAASLASLLLRSLCARHTKERQRTIKSLGVTIPIDAPALQGSPALHFGQLLPPVLGLLLIPSVLAPFHPDASKLDVLASVGSTANVQQDGRHPPSPKEYVSVCEEEPLSGHPFPPWTLLTPPSPSPPHSQHRGVPTMYVLHRWHCRCFWLLRCSPLLFLSPQ